MDNTVIVLTFILCIVFIIGIVCISFIDKNQFDTTNYYIKSHKVEKGETLWELGSFCKRDSDDVRAWIKAVKDLNNMTGSGLIAGDYIKIYIAK